MGRPREEGLGGPGRVGARGLEEDGGRSAVGLKEPLGWVENREDEMGCKVEDGFRSEGRAALVRDDVSTKGG
jgi:hypothetical protein